MPEYTVGQRVRVNCPRCPYNPMHPACEMHSRVTTIRESVDDADTEAYWVNGLPNIAKCDGDIECWFEAKHLQPEDESHA